MTNSIITEGQSLLDVAMQECGTVASVFDLADANGLAITDTLAAGQALAVPESTKALPAVVGYFQGRQRRVNTGAPMALPLPVIHDFDQTDFSPQDFS